MAKGKMKVNLQLLVDQRTRLLADIEALKNKVAGLEMAITLLGKGADDLAVSEAPKAYLKATILDLLKEAGGAGLNASTAVDYAARKGIKLNRGSVASNLSRMVKDKAIVYDGDKYRLPEFVRPILVSASKTFLGNV
jgi:hypothetical protein